MSIYSLGEMFNLDRDGVDFTIDKIKNGFSEIETPADLELPGIEEIMFATVMIYMTRLVQNDFLGNQQKIADAMLKVCTVAVVTDREILKRQACKDP